VCLHVIAFLLLLLSLLLLSRFISEELLLFFSLVPGEHYKRISFCFFLTVPNGPSPFEMFEGPSPGLQASSGIT